MKWIRPRQGPVLFSYPATPVHDYLWSRKPRRQKVLAYALGMIFGLVFLTAMVFPKLQPFNVWVWLATMLKDAVVLGFAYILLTTVAGKALKNQVHWHSFFKNSARIYARVGKSGSMMVYPDMIREWKEREANYQDIPFHFFTVTFKDTIPGLLPNRTVLQFGIPKSEDLHRLRNWAQGHGLVIAPDTV